MNSILRRAICPLGLLLLAAMPAAAQKWQIRYFYDKPTESLELTDIEFPSVNRGIAVGVIHRNNREEPTSVVTADGGQHWDLVALKEPPVSLFFLNENVGWMVSTKGLWQTADGGKIWSKLPKTPGELYRVYFLDENHGWAVGPHKTAAETLDGGKTWKSLAVAAPAEGENTTYSAYTWIAFATPQIGVITGWNIPPKLNTPLLPDWVDPQSTLRQRETAHVSYTLVTRDGGKVWSPSSSSLFGTIARLRFAPNGVGLGLMQYGESFRYPSEVYSVAWPAGGTKTVYRDAKFSVSDIWMTSDGTAYIVGTPVHGQLRNLIPTQIQVLTSKDLGNWTAMPVDYRAEAIGAVFAAADDNHLWIATDTGMILTLAK